MRPRLFEAGASYFNTLGLGALNPIECNVAEELNGAYELNAIILATDPLMEQVTIGSIIAAKPNKTDPIQAFVVEHIGKAINNEIEIYATHIAQHRGKLIPVNKFTANGLTAAIAAIGSNSLETNPFTITTNKTSSATMQTKVPHSFRELLGGTEGSLIDTYGGELYFDNFNVSLLARRGSGDVIQAMYGRNMTDFLHESDFSWNGSVTGVKPYYFSADNYVTSAVKYSQYADLFPYKKTVAVDFSDQFTTVPTASQLATFAQSWINSKGLPAVNLTIAFSDFEKMANGAEVEIGDSVHIINNVYDVDMTSRIVGTDFNVLSEEYNAITIGELKDTVNDAIVGLMDSQNTQKGLDIFPLGSVVTTATNSAPAFAGIWELIGKDFTPFSSSVAEDFFTPNTTNISAVNNVLIVRTNNVITMRLRFTNAVAITGTTIEFGTLNLTKLGLSYMYQTDCIANSDGGNGLLMMRVTGSGLVESLDVVTKTSGGSIAAGNSINMTFIFNAAYQHMLDSACNRFYWKRTA